jgi:hypothetical protein
VSPASATVGTSGSSGERLAVVTASGRIRPARMCAIEVLIWSYMPDT